MRLLFNQKNSNIYDGSLRLPHSVANRTSVRSSSQPQEPSKLTYSNYLYLLSLGYNVRKTTAAIPRPPVRR